MSEPLHEHPNTSAKLFGSWTQCALREAKFLRWTQSGSSLSLGPTFQGWPFARVNCLPATLLMSEYLADDLFFVFLLPLRPL